MALFRKFTTGGSRRVPTELEGVISNLTHVLNTKRGYGSPLADFGIRCLTEYTSRDLIAIAVMQDVRECIEQFEPRLVLHDIAPTEDDNPFRLSFTIKCSLVTNEQVLEVSFDTRLGKFDVGGRR
jgi:type VI secretion system lysozyme-like protein